MDEENVGKTSRIIRILVIFWLFLGLIYFALGSFILLNYSLSALSPGALSHDWILSIGFFLNFFIISIVLFVFAYFSFLMYSGIKKGENLVRNRGILLSIISFIIFLLPAYFFTRIVIEAPDRVFPIGFIFSGLTIISSIICILIIGLLTRSQVKEYFDK